MQTCRQKNGHRSRGSEVYRRRKYKPRGGGGGSEVYRRRKYKKPCVCVGGGGGGQMFTDVEITGPSRMFTTNPGSKSEQTT